MTHFLISGKHRVTSRGWWFFLILVTLVTILILPRTVMAQPKAADLNLWLPGIHNDINLGVSGGQPVLPQPKATDLNLWLHGGQNDYNLDVRAGQDNKLFLDVRNYGTDPITNIKLSVEAPQGWIVAINPSQISSLSAGNINTLDVNINPAGNATTNGQQITFTVQSDETTNQKFSFFVNVKPAQVWVWVWIAAGLVVVAVFVLIFLHFNKQ